MNRILIALVLVGLGLSACGVSVPEALPYPTQTPYPTYTPYPTQRAIPTARQFSITPVRTPVPIRTQQPIFIDEARDTLEDNGFVYFDQYTDTTLSETVTQYAYRYLSVGVFVILWSNDNNTLSYASILFLFDDDRRTRLEYATRGIEALRGIIADGPLAELADLNATFNASPRGRVDRSISGTPYLVAFSKYDDTLTCPAEYSYCHLATFPSITYTGEATFSYYRIDLWITEPIDQEQTP